MFLPKLWAMLQVKHIEVELARVIRVVRGNESFLTITVKYNFKRTKRTSKEKKREQSD